ncbi:MAG: ChbG/HpnK family deacetylase [Thermomicrobiales bacterium]
MNTEQSRNLIVNADDFGASLGINRGIVESYQRGIVTSTSLMVTGRALDDAVRLSAEHPGLAVGLHWDVIGEDDRSFDLDDLKLVRDEFNRQFERFVRAMGRRPTHVDSHRHLHMREPVFSVFRELAEEHSLPLRGAEPVRFVGSFYAQHEWKQTNLDHVSVAYLLDLIEHEVGKGWTEIGCHPGYVDPDFRVRLSRRARTRDRHPD